MSIFILQAVYWRGDFEGDVNVETITIAASHNRQALEEIISSIRKIERPIDLLAAPPLFSECADNWTKKVSEILSKANIPHAYHPEWDWGTEAINFEVNQITEV